MAWIIYHIQIIKNYSITIITATIIIRIRIRITIVQIFSIFTGHAFGIYNNNNIHTAQISFDFNFQSNKSHHLSISVINWWRWASQSFIFSRFEWHEFQCNSCFTSRVCVDSPNQYRMTIYRPHHPLILITCIFFLCLFFNRFMFRWREIVFARFAHWKYGSSQRWYVHLYCQ